MRILLLGEYSNVHWTLAEGLRKIGHHVTIVSNGDFWKDYPRDIDLQRTLTTWGRIKYAAKLITVLPRLRDYDVVQLINPMFLELKANHLFRIYKYLRKHNHKVFLGAFGMDYYWIHECITRKHLRYSDFNIGDRLRTNKEALKEYNDWLETDKQKLNQHIAKDCDGIIAGLYEYWTCYQPNFPNKTSFIPFPIKPRLSKEKLLPHSGPVVIFIGISKNRSAYKGTDIMFEAAKALKEKYPKQVELKIAEGVPFEQYQEMMNGSDVVLDQLYSYTPAMNALEAMANGIVCVGGGEPENYQIIGEKELSPIINVLPNFESVYQALEDIIKHPSLLNELKEQSIDYINKHHNYEKIAKEYLKKWHG